MENENYRFRTHRSMTKIINVIFLILVSSKVYADIPVPVLVSSCIDEIKVFSILPHFVSHDSASFSQERDEKLQSQDVLTKWASTECLGYKAKLGDHKLTLQYKGVDILKDFPVQYGHWMSDVQLIRITSGGQYLTLEFSVEKKGADNTTTSVEYRKFWGKPKNFPLITVDYVEKFQPKKPSSYDHLF